MFWTRDVSHVLISALNITANLKVDANVLQSDMPYSVSTHTRLAHTHTHVVLRNKETRAASHHDHIYDHLCESVHARHYSYERIYIRRVCMPCPRSKHKPHRAQNTHRDREISHFERSPLNRNAIAPSPSKIPINRVACRTSHAETSPLNCVASRNWWHIDTTRPTSQELRFWSNARAYENIPSM